MSDEETKGPEVADTIAGLLGDTIATPGPPPLPGEEGSTLNVVSPELYQVEGEFARGGMGRILRARDLRLGRPVALKELHQGSAPGARRFVREALVTARLQHPSIVPVYEAGRWPDGTPFYSMKLVSGSPLDALIRKSQTLGGRMALLPHVIAVAEAIAFAHSQNIIHRDLKPANVLVGEFGETVVVDWGLAKDLDRPADEDTVGAPSLAAGPEDKTVVGTVMGTPHYMPPEQARGEAVDERADVYALGAILYYVLAGQPPHAGKTATEALAAAAAGPPEPIALRQPGVPLELAAIVGKAMAPAPGDRYPSARELAADLRRFETGQLVSVHEYSALDLARRFVRRNRVAVAVTAFLSLGLVASVALGFLGVKREAQRAAEERDKARLEARKAEEINDFVQNMLGSVDPRTGSRDVTVRQVLDEARTRATAELRDQPEIQAAVLLTIASSYEGLGLYDQAEPLVRAGLEARRRVLGPSHRDVARAMTQLGGVVRGQGDVETSVGLYRDALLMLHGLGQDDSLDAARAKSELASADQALGKWDEAERLHREALEQKRRLLGSDNSMVATSLNNLGVVLGQRGDWKGAEALHRESLAILRKIHGEEHMEVAAGLRTLGTVLESEGRFDEAEPLLRESADLCRKLLGPEHPDTAWTLYNYAYLLWRKGDSAGAIRLAREVLALRGKTLGDAHPLVAASLQVLGLGLLQGNRAAEALAPFEESLSLRRRTLPAGHWLIAASESVLGLDLTALHRYPEAEALLLSGYHGLRAAVGESHERTVEARARLAALYEAWHKPEKARAFAPLAPAPAQ